MCLTQFAYMAKLAKNLIYVLVGVWLLIFVDLGPSRGLMTQIFVFADVEFGVRKYETKKYEPSAWFCT